MSMNRVVPVAVLLLAIAVAATMIPLSGQAACVGGVCNATSTKSVSFMQNLYVVGAVTKGSGSFVIDHPLDPKNKLLYHSFVESPDMMNVYDGIATLDEVGETAIELPAYFIPLNQDYRYLATPMGEPMPNLHLTMDVRMRYLGLFGAPTLVISGGEPGGRISWQVTGIRRDPLARSNRLVPEVPKEGSGLVAPGNYLHPEAYPAL